MLHYHLEHFYSACGDLGYPELLGNNDKVANELQVVPLTHTCGLIRHFYVRRN